MLSCKEATLRMSEAQDRDLSMTETLGLEMHLLLCGGCRRYREQMNFLHRICLQHPARPGGDDRNGN